MISTENLCFYYGKKCVLNNVNITFSAGFNVLLGPNGAGKSTFISLLTHLVTPSSGHIVIDGSRLETSTSKIMSRFGVVFQQPTLDLDLTVSQNLCYHGALHGLSKQQVMANCAPLLAHLGLIEKMDEKIRKLNGGHRRRVELVRALGHKPNVLLLDEASVGLDNEVRAQIIHYIRELASDGNLCVIWTTHLLDEIEPSDQLVVLNQGSVIASSKVDDLLVKHDVDRISELYMALTNQGALNAI